MGWKVVPRNCQGSQVPGLLAVGDCLVNRSSGRRHSCGDGLAEGGGARCDHDVRHRLCALLKTS